MAVLFLSEPGMWDVWEKWDKKIFPTISSKSIKCLKSWYDNFLKNQHPFNCGSLYFSIILNKSLKSWFCCSTLQNLSRIHTSY